MVVSELFPGARVARNYKVAPVVEAIIELRVAGQVEFKKLAKVQNKLIVSHGLSENLLDITLAGEVGTIPAIKQTPTGYRLTSADGTEVALIKLNAIAVTRRAPYSGWESLFERLQAAWAAFKPVSGGKKLTRIGVRFINRIDIPVTQGRLIEETDYLRIGTPTLPFKHGIFSNFSSSVQTKTDDQRYGVTIQTGTALSPLINHASLLLDIDLACELEVPQVDNDIRLRLAEMRNLKNEIFEAYITDRARELFDV